ncbi:hypothetical protein C478_07287 [Natrinema thermotolerans DSM 11552]|nr:hypothetical protein C478_07287 [Natrinema thermotolerans DSM 11552]
MESPRLVAVGVALLLVSAGLFGVATTPVAADHQEGGITDGLITSESDNSSDGWLPGWVPDAPSMDVTQAAASGWMDRVTHSTTSFLGLGGSGPSAEEVATNVADEYNNNSAAYESWADEHAGVYAGHDTVEITFKTGGDTATRYLTADIVTENGSETYANSSVVKSIPDDRTVDETVTVSGLAAENAASELETLRTEYIETGETIQRNDATVVKMWATYSGDIEASILGGDL